MTTDQIQQHIEKCQDLIDRINEYKCFIDELKTGIMSKLGNQDMNKQSIRQYNECIVNLEAELQHLWNNR